MVLAKIATIFCPSYAAKNSIGRSREATVHHSGSGRFAIRKGDWVLIAGPGGDDNGGASGEPEWLQLKRDYPPHKPAARYNLRLDLAERQNAYADNPEIVRRIKALLETYIRMGRSTPGQPQQNDVPIDPARLPG